MDKWLGLVVLAGVFYLAGQYVASAPQRVQQEVEAGRELAVAGTGKAVAKPDVARVHLGVVSGPRTTAEAALEIVAERFEAVLKAVRAVGVAEDDIRTTNLSINPVYDFASGRQIPRGFEASETVEVTIRDLKKVGEVVSRATVEGVNQAGGVNFEVDDIEKVRLEAQQKAIEDAKSKADELVKTLGVRLGRVKTFAAHDAGGPIPLYARAESLPAGVGGDTAVPPVPAGTQEIVVNVTVTYELR